MVAAGKLGRKSAEEIYSKSVNNKSSFDCRAGGLRCAVRIRPRPHPVGGLRCALDQPRCDRHQAPSRGLLDSKICQDYRVVVLSKRNNRLMVATADPSDQRAAEKIKFSTQLGVDWIIAEYDKLSRMVEADKVTATEAVEDIIGGDFEFDENATDTAAETNQPTAEVEDAPVVRFLQKMLLDAVSMRASDLHFEPYEHSYRVRFRVDGQLREIASPPVAIKDKLASRIKVISRMDISEKRVPQDGRMKLKVGTERVIDFRVSTLPTLFGEKIVIRILDPNSAKLGIDALGYDAEEKERLLKAVGRPYGMILVTGPTGSGKTVSLYTCLNMLNQPGVNIATVEDPSEINLPGVNQVNVNEKAGLTFAAALQFILATRSRHHHGGRNSRCGNRGHFHQGGANRPLGAVDLAHKRRALDAHAHAQYGHTTLQYRIQCDLDHGPAFGTAAVPELPGRHRDTESRTDRCRLCTGTIWTEAGSPTSLSGVPAAIWASRAGLAFTRSCPSRRPSSASSCTTAARWILPSRLSEKVCARCASLVSTKSKWV